MKACFETDEMRGIKNKKGKKKPTRNFDSVDWTVCCHNKCLLCRIQIQDLRKREKIKAGTLGVGRFGKIPKLGEDVDVEYREQR